MKKYTVIYSEYFQTGSNQNSITKMKHIECVKENLNKTVEEEVGWSNVWFILDGHCEPTSD
jgi:hypothetical protein